MANTKRVKEPTDDQVAASMATITRCALEQVGTDYRGGLSRGEQRLLTAVYTQRITDRLNDPEVGWDELWK